MADPVLSQPGPPPTVADVERIAALADPVVRNLQITQFAELSTAFASPDRAGANWCTFATWASRQAARRSTKEDLARTLKPTALWPVVMPRRRAPQVTSRP